MVYLTVLELLVLGQQPTKTHFSNVSDCIWRYVTHDAAVGGDPNFVNFNKGMRWAANRNWLCRYALDELNPSEYYMFIDYDVDLKSNTKVPPVEQIIADLKMHRLAVMTLNDPTKKDNAGLPPRGVRPGSLQTIR